MLNPFPELLSLSFFAPTLLRIAAGGLLAYVAYTHWSERQELARIQYPIVGSGTWIVWITLVWLVASSTLLFLGFYTQIAALMGALVSLKFFILRHHYPSFATLERPASLLLFIICLSLLVTGAGTYAFDIRL